VPSGQVVLTAAQCLFGVISGHIGPHEGSDVMTPLRE
jgi:hypothetical protein